MAECLARKSYSVNGIRQYDDCVFINSLLMGNVMSKASEVVGTLMIFFHLISPSFQQLRRAVSIHSYSLKIITCISPHLEQMDRTKDPVMTCFQ